MSSVDQVLVGRIGIAPAGQGNPTIILDSTTGTISGNFTINANTNFNAPNVNAIFESLLLSDQDFPANSTTDRLTVQLPNTNDVIKVDYRGAIFRQNATTLQANWILGAPEANNGYSFRINTSQPNLQLYAPDSGGAVALYNTGNSAYSWYLGTAGDASFGNISARSNVQVNGNLTVNGTITGLVTETVTPYVVTSQSNPANIFTGPNGDSVVLVNVVGGNPVPYPAVVLPIDAVPGTTVSVILANPGAGFPLVQTTSPASGQFRGQGFQLTLVNLSTIRGGSSSQNYVVNFTYVNYGGVFGDDWLVTVS